VRKEFRSEKEFLGLEFGGHNNEFYPNFLHFKLWQQKFIHLGARSWMRNLWLHVYI